VSARSVVAELPNAPGVCRFRDARELVLCIGRAINLRCRVGSYWTQPAGRLAEMVTRIARIEAVICQSEHEAAWLERNLLEQARPPWNKPARDQEVPVFLRLDWRTRSPGISVVHSVKPSTRVRHFGPYLGGSKVRLAASALHRVMPVAYTGELRHQSDHDMARIRGIDPTARLDLFEQITSVLERTPGAVTALRAQLVSRRDAAAQNLDFERASRVSEQKRYAFRVTGLRGVRLVTRYPGALRLSRRPPPSWTQRPCTQPDAQPYLAATPANGPSSPSVTPSSPRSRRAATIASAESRQWSPEMTAARGSVSGRRHLPVRLRAHNPQGAPAGAAPVGYRLWRLGRSHLAGRRPVRHCCQLHRVGHRL